jgi:hypothetical protein
VTVRGLRAGKQRAALGEMCLAIPAHEVLAHEPRHQPLGLAGGQDVDPLLLPMDISAFGQKHRAAKGGDTGHGRLGPKAGEVGVGVLPESNGVDIDNRRVQDVFLSLLDRSLVSGLHPGKKLRGRPGTGRGQSPPTPWPKEVASKPTIDLTAPAPACPGRSPPASSAPSGLRRSGGSCRWTGCSPSTSPSPD